MAVATDERQPSGIVPPPIWHGGDGNGNSWESHVFPVSRAQVAVWIFLTGVVMLFAGFSSAYIVLRGVSTWQNIAMPGILWVNTIILLLSSLTIELGRRAIRKGLALSMKWWVALTTVLGMVFLAGQLIAWSELKGAGIDLSTTLHSSFFYILTGAHGIHLLGGLVALTYVAVGAWRHRYTIANHEPLDLLAVYWHFLDGLWLYLLLMFLLA